MGKPRTVVTRHGKPVQARRKATVRVIREGSPRLAPAYGVVRVAACRSSSEKVHIMDVPVAPVDSFVERATRVVHEIVTKMGGRVSMVALREIISNLFHADFRDASILVTQEGNEVTVTDRGPGIADKEKALLPGYTTATASLREHIRGVGAGLPLACQSAAADGGALSIDDNLGGGTVVKLSAIAPNRAMPPEPSPTKLSEREKKVLLLLGEEQRGGPSAAAQALGVSISTAHRLLEKLERMGLVVTGPKGKRELSEYALANFELLIRGDEQPNPS